MYVWYLYLWNFKDLCILFWKKSSSHHIPHNNIYYQPQNAYYWNSSKDPPILVVSWHQWQHRKLQLQMQWSPVGPSCDSTSPHGSWDVVGFLSICYKPNGLRVTVFNKLIPTILRNWLVVFHQPIWKICASQNGLVKKMFETTTWKMSREPPPCPGKKKT